LKEVLKYVESADEAMMVMRLWGSPNINVIAVYAPISKAVDVVNS
jgi:hypothetical protein